MFADTFGRPLRFRITPGQASDIASTPHLLEGQRGGAVLADKAYDGNDFRDRIATMNATAVIPSKRNRKVGSHVTMAKLRPFAVVWQKLSTAKIG